MAKSGLIKQVGKGGGSIVLWLACALFATYARRHFPGWGFVVSLLMVVAASIPMVLFFNLFSSSSTTESSRRFEVETPNDDWDDLFSPWHRSDDD
ncbi:hypothetical protein [Pseudomonas jessenii]|uniref:hypothetical protein n=1 Tax=Pseudomonas jessenii TaxID=77298 RepID=UPI0039E05472